MPPYFQPVAIKSMYLSLEVCACVSWVFITFHLGCWPLPLLLFIIWKTIEKRPILSTFLLVIIWYACHFSVILFLVSLFALISLVPFQLLTPPLYVGKLSPCVFCLLILWHDIDSMHFVSFPYYMRNIFSTILTCASNRPGWSCQPIVILIAHITLLNLKLLMFTCSQQYASNLCSLMLNLFLPIAFMLFCDVSHKNAFRMNQTMVYTCGSQSMGRKLGCTKMIQTWVVYFLHPIACPSVCSVGTWERSRLLTLQNGLNCQNSSIQSFEACVVRCSPNQNLGGAKKSLGIAGLCCKSWIHSRNWVSKVSLLVGVVSALCFIWVIRYFLHRLNRVFSLCLVGFQLCVTNDQAVLKSNTKNTEVLSLWTETQGSVRCMLQVGQEVQRDRLIWFFWGWYSCFFRWNISVICLTVVLKQP